MDYKIKYIPIVMKQLSKLDKPIAKNIVKYMKSVALNPTKFGKPLQKNLKGFWRYRVGDYRVISLIEHDALIVMVVRIGHRKKVYQKFEKC